MTVEEQETRQIETEPNSHRYGNNQQTDEVYEDPTYPKPPELVEALEATSHLTGEEARAFVWGLIEHFPPVPHGSKHADDVVQSIGFDDMAEFEDAMERSKAKVADAIWIYELLDAYRSPPRSECIECGTEIQGPNISPEGEEGTICGNCADRDIPRVEPDTYH